MRAEVVAPQPVLTSRLDFLVNNAALFADWPFLR